MTESPIRAVGGFLILVLVCAALIAATHALTREPIEENRLRQFQRTLVELAGSVEAAGRVRWTEDTAPLCNGRTLLRGSASGYGGPIRWLAAAAPGSGEPELIHVRISAHQETPGIADFLDEPESGWLADLSGRSAATLAAADTVSGATITSRALLRSLAAALGKPSVDDPACAP